MYSPRELPKLYIMNLSLEDLKQLDTIPNLQHTLDLVLEGYLTSDYANDKAQRTKAIVLFNQLKRLE